MKSPRALLGVAVIATAAWAVGPGLSLAAPVSINSTSDNRATVPAAPVKEQPNFYAMKITPLNYTVLAVNDLGMHCGDLDTRLASILPPFNVLHSVVLKKGPEPTIQTDAEVSVSFSAASSVYDTVLDTVNNPQPAGYHIVGGGAAFTGVFKTNWWDEALNLGAYNPFYPVDFSLWLPISMDRGLVVPDPAHLPALTVAQQSMPGILGPYVKNDQQRFARYDNNLQFFRDFPFGYTTGNLRWFGADGIPVTTFDDSGRVNPYPLMRVSAISSATRKTVATIDTVTPVSGEANCRLCHTNNDASNGPVGGYTATAQGVSLDHKDANGDVDNRGNTATAFDDVTGYGTLPLPVSVEYAQDLNVLRYHDRSFGANYRDSAGNLTKCVISRWEYRPAAGFNNSNGSPKKPLEPELTWPNGDENCLSNKAHDQNKPIVCQACHYTPALDLTQVGPIGGSADYPDNGTAACPPNADPVNCVANGRTQRNKGSMSRAIHNRHAGFSATFPMPSPGDPLRDYIVTGPLDMTCNKPSATTGLQAQPGSRVYAQCDACTDKPYSECVVENTCYNCHPGRYTKCLRGVMGSNGMLCQDCHGGLPAVANDFSQKLTPDNPFPTGADLTKRVPWASEPGCQSCHVGDAVNQPENKTGFIYADDGIRLLQAWVSPDQVFPPNTLPVNDPDATPIASPNSRFAEDQSVADANHPSNRILFRLSRGSRTITLDTSRLTMRTGHHGVFCEGCHGPTHAEWPVTPDAPNHGAWPPPKGSFAANDNVTAGQLQGHTGKIIECATCHTGTFELENGLGGAHGLHPVGGSVGAPPAVIGAAGYSQWWVNNHGDYLKRNGTPTCDQMVNDCGTCHGPQGQGTPLSEMAQTRTVAYFGGRLKTLTAGSELACTNCHSRDPGGPMGACTAPSGTTGTLVSNP